jgi:ankyrin repeat protein
LIDNGADVNVKDVDGASALDFAIIREHPEVVKVLKKAGAKQ